MNVDKSGWSSDVKLWSGRVDEAQKRLKEFRKAGGRVTAIYEAEKKQDFQYNILYSNTETLQPALYNNVPRPVVQRRYKDSDPVGKAASEVIKRTLEYLIDSNDQDYSNFDSMMTQAVLEGLVPGMGLTRFKYDPKYGAEIPQTTVEGEEPVTESSPLHEVEAETVCGEEIPWDRILYGYAKKWKDLPWLGIEHFMTKEEVAANFDAATAEKVPYSSCSGKEDSDGDEGSRKIEESSGDKLAHIIEIWDKTSKKVKFLCLGYGEMLKDVDDPLKLSGFFPCPEPLTFMSRISSMIPKALYEMYEEQAKELNTCTIRINKIMRAAKVRGFYDATLTGLKELMAQEDNTLMPAENVSAMLQGQTLDRAIWFFPVEKLVGMLQQLYIQREQVKNVIYEITGISDILRGSSVASETATAQNIKNQWGTLRLKRMQKRVMKYVRDSLRIMAEIAVTKLSQETLAAMTGLKFPTAQEKQAGELQKQQALQQAQMAGQPPPPPPPGFVEMMSSPTWEEVMSVLQSDLQRNYRIDIETNSTIDAEASEDKQDVAEFMNAMAQFLNGIAPVIEQGMMTFDVAKGILLSIVKRFRFGVEVEDQIMNMQGPLPRQQGEDPKLAAEKAKIAAETELGQAQMKMQLEKSTAEQELGKQQLQMQAIKLQAEQEFGKQQLQFKVQEMQAEHEFAMLQHQMKMEELELKREEIAAKKAVAAQTKADAEKGKTNANV